LVPTVGQRFVTLIKGKKMTNNKEWKNLCRVGAIAALFAAILFRRNIGAEVSLFTGVEGIPSTVIDWFLLLDAKPFIGLSFLAAFDLINGLLVGVVFLGLGAALWQRSRSRVVLALSSGLMGIAISLSSNISLTMVSLTHQFTGAASEAQKNALISAGQSLLAANSPMGGFPNTGTFISYLLISLAGLIFASLLLPTNRFSGVIGLIAAGCDLIYCLTIPFTPALQTLLMASGGAFWMIWHILAAKFLLDYAKIEQQTSLRPVN
jgi:hypothetical protein